VITFTLVFTRDTTSRPTAPSTMIPADPPTMSPTDFTTISRFSKMRSVIASPFEDDFPNSPLQESALNWLVTTDPANLAVNIDPPTLLERYTAALFYFATVGALWYDDSNWLTVNAVCFWRGLDCKEEGFLTMMNLGTCLLSSFCL
jgi:hypothetical protein